VARLFVSLYRVSFVRRVRVFTKKTNSSPDSQSAGFSAAPQIGALSPAMQPSAASAALQKESGGASASETAAGAVVIGKGTKITGEITDCARLEIQGTVDGTIVADALIVREGGVVKGNVRAVHAEIHGRFEGQLAVQDVLDVRGTGHVEGDLSYGRLAVAMGGYISGKVNGETGGAGRSAPAEAMTPTVSVPPPPNGAVANGYAAH
jgi:cytoskeletal protein CcmA (bactofilin family)